MSTKSARDDSIDPVLEALIDSGECADRLAVETQLQARGYTASAARIALADADRRRAVTGRCINARVRRLGSEMSHPARLDPSALYRKPDGWG